MGTDDGGTADGGTADGGTADGGTADGGTADGGTDGGGDLDADGDGYGVPEPSTLACDAGEGWAETDDDCDDDDAAVNPGATELCDEDDTDEDCDGDAEEGEGVYFLSTAGDGTDLTSLISTGTADSGYDYDIDRAGTLYVCEGTWYFDIEITLTGGEVSILGIGDAEDIIVDAAGFGPTIDSWGVERLTLRIFTVTGTHDRPYGDGGGLYLLRASASPTGSTGGDSGFFGNSGGGLAMIESSSWPSTTVTWARTSVWSATPTMGVTETLDGAHSAQARP